MSGMLEQAIADAAALKEAALRKAEHAVLEAAKPKIEETLKSLLEEENDEGLDDLLDGAADMQADMGAGEISGVADTTPMGITDGEKMCPCPDEEEEIEIDFNELEKQMAADEEAEDMGQAELAQDLNLSSPDDSLGASMDAMPDELETDEEEVELDEENLSSLMEEDSKDEESSDEEENEMTGAEEMHRGNLEAGDEVIKESKNVILESELDAKLAREGKVIVSQKKLAEIVRSATEELFTTKAKELNEAIEKNKELKSFVEKLTSKLKESNLRNARLVYINQILESVSLNERQKKKIVEAVSEAGSVKEAKVIYETLIHSVGSSEEKKQRKQPKSLTEAVEKRSTPMFPRRHKPEKHNSPEKERMQKLAGIK